MGVLWILLFVCWLFFVVYMLYGTATRYRRGIRTIPFVVPHYRFWCRLLHYCLLIISCGRVRWTWHDPSDLEIFYEGMPHEEAEEEEYAGGFPATVKGEVLRFGPSATTSASVLAQDGKRDAPIPSKSGPGSRLPPYPPSVPVGTAAQRSAHPSQGERIVKGVVSTTSSEPALRPPLSASSLQHAENAVGAGTDGAPRQAGHTAGLEDEDEDFEMEAEMNPSEIVVVY